MELNTDTLFDSMRSVIWMTDATVWLGDAEYTLSLIHICVRILSRNANDVFDEAFYLRRLSHAWEYRKTVLSGEVSSCRVIFGEADLFPGLTVDRFGRYLVHRRSLWASSASSPCSFRCV